MGDITLRKALEDYKTIYMAYRNFAQRTRVEYQNDLEDFIDFAEKSDIHYANKVGIPIVERFIAGLEHQGFSSLTRKRKVVTLRSFFSFLHRDGYIHANIASMIILPFTETTAPNVLTQTECDRLRALCAGNARDKAMIELLLQTGIKLSELTHLTLNDIDIETGTETLDKQKGFMRIAGSRGKRERLISLNGKACLALNSYLDTRNDGGSSILFLNRFGEPIGEGGVQKVLRKYLKSAEIGKASIHTLRHTFGAQHASKGASTKTLQDVMGLKDVRSTLVYYSLAQEVTRREMQEKSIIGST